MEYSIVENGIVTNIVTADSPLGANWYVGNHGIGATHDAVTGTFTAPLIPVIPTPIDSTQWLIDVGPFFDRFGALKMAILTSQDVGVKAILTDLQVRHWIDLKRPDVAQGLAYVGSVVPSLTSELQNTILTTPVTVLENSVLRKLYF